MKKSNTLAQQIIKAQKAIESWPDSLKSGLKLEKPENFLAQTPEDSRHQGTTNRRHTNN